MFIKVQKESGETENQQGDFPSRLLKVKNKLLQTKLSQEIFQRGVTVFCCVCIIVFGITLLSKADPITTSIGQDISTNNLSLSGSVTSGTWAGSNIDIAHGGTGQDWSAGTQGSLPFFSGTGVLSTLTPGIAGQVLQSEGAGANPSWGNVTRSATFVIAASDSAIKSKQQADYVCDGTDDNVEIQAAIDALPANGGSVQFLEGTFILDATTVFYNGLINKCAIKIQGNNIALWGTKGTIFKLKDGINIGGSIVATITMVGTNISIQNIHFDNNHNNIAAQYNIPIWTGSSGLTTSHVDISQNYFENMDYAIWGDGSSENWDIHNNIVVPIASGGGIAFHNGPSNSRITNNTIANNSDIDLAIFLDSVDNVLVSGNQMKNIKTNGVEIYDDVNYCKVTNNIFNGGSGRGITMHDKGNEASSNNYNVIQGNNFINIHLGIATTLYTKYTTIKDNVFVGVATPMNNMGPGSAILQNVGYVTANSGTSTITAGQASVTVTHGLATTPTRVQLTPTTDTAGKRYWISAKTATTFTITIDSTHTSDITFDWRGVVGEGN